MRGELPEVIYHIQQNSAQLSVPSTMRSKTLLTSILVAKLHDKRDPQFLQPEPDMHLL